MTMISIEGVLEILRKQLEKEKEHVKYSEPCAIWTCESLIMEIEELRKGTSHVEA